LTGDHAHHFGRDGNAFDFAIRDVFDKDVIAIVCVSAGFNDKRFRSASHRFRNLDRAGFGVKANIMDRSVEARVFLVLVHVLLSQERFPES